MTEPFYWHAVFCDECGKPANTVHFVPWATNADCERCVFCCPDHDADGYWLPVPMKEPSLAHLAGKGWKAVALLAERMAKASDRDDAAFHKATQNLLGGNGWTAVPWGRMDDVVAESHRIVVEAGSNG